MFHFHLLIREDEYIFYSACKKDTPSQFKIGPKEHQERYYLSHMVPPPSRSDRL
jgi:hypothetical protein